MKKKKTKRMINLSNSSDEYHTANDESFTTISATGQQQQQQSGVVGATPPTTLAARKQLSPADPNEPAKPLSAYALFFRDTVSAIKQQNPNCTFQELSKIVSSMWEALDPVHKAVYNKKNELAKNEYIKQMRIYRQQQPQTAAAADGSVTIQQTQSPNTNKQSTIFTTMNLNQQQSATPNFNQNSATTQPQMAETVVSNNQAPATVTAAATVNPPAASSGGGGDQVQIITDGGEVIQKCTRENCNKRAIVNPDWEDEYCSNECVVIHCRNVFNAWVQSNLEAKKQQQQQTSEMQQTPGANT
ncbi:uncharacterized protein isoform X3 [Musca autumnalis]|uniref:uncharacterized protein isoform X3 n=1 Tax=Musca autumnalis TaxID=221902 RepID=UPI003CEE8720